MQQNVNNIFLFFLDNCPWTGFRNFPLLQREYLSSAVNVLTNSPKISDMKNREPFRVNLSQIEGNLQ